MRRTSAMVAGLLVLTGLTACSGSDATDCGVSSGNASSAVSATGEFGSVPDVTFPTPLVSGSIEKSVIERGSSAPLRDGQPVLLDATILNGADGSVLQETTYVSGGSSLLTAGGLGVPAVSDALECATLGSRIAVVAASDYGGAPGAQAGGTIVYVVDVVRAFHSRADGADQTARNDMPSVVTAPDGTPGITIPNETAPTDFRTSILKLGDGPEIGADDLVVAKLTIVNWETGQLVPPPGTTEATRDAAVLPLDPATLGEGLVSSIEGETVGSQILSVIPPGLAAPAGQAGPTTDTLVYVIDILGTVN